VEDFAAQISGIGALAEPARLALYQFVIAQPDAVSRDQAAAGVGLARHNAKFHLDRLVDEGLLDVEFRRLSGRRGPGAGRPSKLYRRSNRELSVTLPERRYDLAGLILAEAVAVAARDGVPVLDAVMSTARERGHRLGAEALQSDGEEPASVEQVLAVLARYGYEPRVQGGEVVLMNCPFHSLAQEQTELVCGMNVAAITGLLEGMRAAGLAATLAPAPGQCCVSMHAAS
jgi:predicted ArsR family transcriptional regulator